MVLVRKQSLSSIGLTRCNAKKSLLSGGVLGSCFILINVITAILSGKELTDIGTLFYNVFYFFVIIGFTEEVVFRGYIQTRLYGILQSDTIAVIVGGVLFSLMHIPYKMSMLNMDLLSYLQSNYMILLFLILWHVVFNFLYRKYNSLLAPTIFHGFMDFSNSLFR
jgi:membrane protease YdiL (CAAX protease family)